MIDRKNENSNQKPQNKDKEFFSNLKNVFAK